MNSKIVFFCVLFFGSDYLEKISGLPERSEGTPESHPFQVAVKAKSWFPSGILITNNYVVTLANCMKGSTTVTVYLGFYECPFYKSNHLDQNTQIIPSSSIIIHEDFAAINDDAGQYINNIALVKLSQPATLSKTVQPGTLLSRQESYLVEGKYAEVSGWMHGINENKKMGTVQIRNRDTCSYLFGDEYLRSQQICVKWLTKTLFWLGNAVRIGDNIIGLYTYGLICTVETSDCSIDDVVLNFIPFLDWISHKMNVSIEEFTSKSPESCDNHDLIKLESSVKKINETFYNYNKKFENILTQEALDEHLMNLNDTVQLKINEQTDKLKEQNKELANQTNNKLEERYLELQTELVKKLNDTEITQMALDERFGNINTTIKNILNEQHFNKLEKTVVDTVKAVENIKLEVQIRLGEIEKVFKEQKHRMDEYIVQESTLHQSLRAEIKSMNARLNKIIGFIYNDPF